MWGTFASSARGGFKQYGFGGGGILAEGISNLIQITKSNFNPSQLMIFGDKTLMQTSNSELVQKVPSSEFALRKKTWRFGRKWEILIKLGKLDKNGEKKFLTTRQPDKNTQSTTFLIF